MKLKNNKWHFSFIAIALVFALSISCKKEDSKNNTNTNNPNVIAPPDATITDGEGNTYKTVVIGTQTWMAENLKVTKYRNGDSIGTTYPATKNTHSETSPKFQWAYNGVDNNAATYGRLYTWYTITDSRNVCPAGWHVPTDAEWTMLEYFLGGDSIAGGKLKEVGTAHWLSPNIGATNETGFTALPGGGRNYFGPFYYVGDYGGWWSTTEYDTTNAWCCTLSTNSTGISRGYDDKKAGFSVRCVKD
ncbi:MAG: fibrobacter succinogenes major paralogous domain-containing protein [Bacteroidota bacterium]